MDWQPIALAGLGGAAVSGAVAWYRARLDRPKIHAETVAVQARTIEELTELVEKLRDLLEGCRSERDDATESANRLEERHREALRQLAHSESKVRALLARVPEDALAREVPDLVDGA